MKTDYQKLEVHSTGSLPHKWEIHPEGDEHGLEVIADIYSEDKKVADLFAAAPDLLTAVNHFYELHKNGNWPGNDDIDMLYNALKKARGETA